METVQAPRTESFMSNGKTYVMVDTVVVSFREKYDALLGYFEGTFYEHSEYYVPLVKRIKNRVIPFSELIGNDDQMHSIRTAFAFLSVSNCCKPELGLYDPKERHPDAIRIFRGYEGLTREDHEAAYGGGLELSFEEPIDPKFVGISSFDDKVLRFVMQQEGATAEEIMVSLLSDSFIQDRHRRDIGKLVENGFLVGEERYVIDEQRLRDIVFYGTKVDIFMKDE